ncbi:glycosyltransferase family 4 protein [Flavobacterium sp. LB3P122]|uniref:glycosyltransferase family 4 protein n=1 Tax=Flavobacterium algoriphilum TaxID=3398738 RepID=UPI003A8BF637
MRIIQIIDSLESGGAERMAVSYANALAGRIEFSGLVVTRKEGPLLNQIDKQVSYLYLNKKRAVDFKAILRLRAYVRKNNVTVIHAHSTSFFLAFLLKLSCPYLSLIWHDHYGDSDFLEKRPMIGLRATATFFNGIIVVNQKLKIWAEKELKIKNTIYLSNFPAEENIVSDDTKLKGAKGKRIVCLANLRVQKDHFLLLEVAKKIKIIYPEWSFHLIGKDFYDAYSQQIKNLIVAFDLEENVFLYGSKQDVKNILDQSTIAVLASQSEGLPVALLEYGWHKKPVVVTDVGEISSLVQSGKNGFVVAAHQNELFFDAVVKLIGSESLQMNFGQELFQRVVANHSEEVVIEQYLNWLDNSPV